MDNDEYVKKLYKRENELIKIVNYHGIYNEECRDIIQEVYLLLLQLKDIKRYEVDNEPNMYIIFAIIKNMIYHFRKKENKYIFDRIEDINIGNEEEIDNEKYNFIINEIEKINYWFDKELIKLYVYDEHSLRSLSKATKISVHYIFPIIKRFKEKCIENYKKTKN